jgi:predicted AAA+ superfamily ATPase
MTHIPRKLDLKKLVSRKSLFLLGPRQTGKSSLIRQIFPETKVVNLLLNEEYFRYQRDPGLLSREFKQKKPQLIVIDEIQRIPELLNEVHYLIEESKHRFLLTGSSARKLKKAGTNLLGGRASQITLHSFTRAELGKKMDLMKALSYGLLPSIYFSDEPKQELRDYVGTYLKEEIMAEGLTRNLPAFSRFLDVAAHLHGKMINYSKVANDAQLSPSTTYEYFRILEDTLIGRELVAYDGTKKRKAISTSKFYFFDLGVVRSLLGRGEINKNDADFGEFFESYLAHELMAATSYQRLAPLKYWRSKSNFEVDFIFDDRIAIEVKTTKKVNSDDIKGLKALAEEGLMEALYLVSMDSKEQVWDGVTCLPWPIFLDRLAAGL